MIEAEIKDRFDYLEVRLDAMIEHEREQRKKFMIALVEAGEEGLL